MSPTTQTANAPYGYKKDGTPKLKPGPKAGDPRMAAAGKLGGAVNRTKGPEFFAAIGKQGGLATRDKYGPAFFSQIGRKGGETLKRERGLDFYTTIGRKGGAAGRKAS